MKWGFVDYENTGSLEGIDIQSYERLLIFCGPKNNKLKFGDISTTEFTKIELIAIKTNGSNNLDFHLVFYLGRYHETADANVEFHVISNDDGFNGVVNHIEKIGRKCKKVATRTKTPKKNNKGKMIESLSECAELIASRLKQIDDKARPRKKDSLSNWIKSQCHHLKPEINSNKIFEELERQSCIVVHHANVSYRL